MVMSGASSVTTQRSGASVAATMKAQGQTIDADTLAASQGIAAVGIAGLGLPFFACTGLPVVLFCALMANANRRGLRQEKQHEQALAAQQAQFQAMSQAAQAQTAQAHIQFAQMQQQAPRSPAPIQIAAEGSDIKAQFEAAKALIDAKQYNAARKLLRTINHPKAQEWIAKLEGK